MKMTKQDRDNYVLENYLRATNSQLAAATGWSVTTIKSSLIRQGLSRRVNKKLEEDKRYIQAHNNLTDLEISKNLGCKVDKVRDLRKALSIFNTVHSKIQKRIEEQYEGLFYNIGEYKGSKEPISYTCCQCDTVRTSRADVLANKGAKCQVCTKTNNLLENQKLLKVRAKVKKELQALTRIAGNQRKKLEAQKYADLVSREGIKITVLRCLGKAKKECRTCGHVKLLQGGTRFYSARCEVCNIHASIDQGEETLFKALENVGAELLSVYRGDRLPVEIECAKGHRREILAATAKRGYSCPQCLWDNPCSVYVLSGSGYVKVGISSNIVKRVQELSAAWGFEWRIESETVLESRGIARAVEFKAHEDLYELRAFNDGPDGYTEVFDVSVQDACALVQDLCKLVRACESL